MANDWNGCCKASNRLADLVCAMYHPRNEQARRTFPTSTWAKIIAAELGIEIPDAEPPNVYSRRPHRSA